MDFASLMSAEISKSKSPPVQSQATKKYLKKAELETQRQEAYLQEQAALQREREAKVQQKRKRDDEEACRDRERDEKRRKLAEESRLRREEQEAREEKARRRRLGLPPLSMNEEAAQGETPPPEGEEDIPDSEVQLRLRAINEPITLFGETRLTRLRRYKNLTAPQSLNSVSKSSGPIPTALEPVPEADLKINVTLPKEVEARTYLYRQLSTYFNLIFTEWIHTLRNRDASVKQSTQGRQAEATMQSTLTSLVPLVQKMESNTLTDSILKPLLEIVCAVQERRYVDANDGYLRLSIGKAAWPIGVTMVGIHERSAREKLHESDVQGHIMSDEVTRKFLQGIKRCLSFAQTRWPPEDFGQLMG